MGPPFPAVFRKVLIANRGEIAVRVCRTLDAMGVASAAVYAHADRGALHVEAAGEAHPLGDGGVSETYLDIGKLLDAVERSGADAVHPGYGFLSENAAFARALAERGVAFVGPRPEHLARFGLKHEARRLATDAGVALLPGSGVLADVEDALREAAAIGYPVMLKSSAGGGGIGMQRCEDANELAERFAAVERLAGSAFGDARLFVERCVPAPRHVEVQAFGDGEGGVAILGDRDCSLQRRHQKVVEECPAPNLPEAVRRRMHEDARALLASVSYRSAGTVEFLYDPGREEATFLEVNTRLQVEHGVTELVYGVDLVRWMLELAAGELPPLDALTADLAPSGCAIQARLCAEDPNHGFRPTPGWLSVVAFPDGPGLRTDTWLRSGTEVSPLYDSLLAKVMAHATTREEARRRLRDRARRERRARRRDEPRVPAPGPRLRRVRGGAPRHGDPRYPRLSAAYRRSAGAGRADHGTGLARTHGVLARRRAAVRPHGRPLVPARQPAARQCRGCAGLEVTVGGPTLAFHGPARVLVAGAVELRLERPEGAECPETWRPFAVDRGDVLTVGDVTSGVRAYLLFSAGLDVPEVMGSAATFTLGGIGGMNGRALAAGDVLRIGTGPDADGPDPGGRTRVPGLDARHVLRVTMGPHCTDDFLTPADLDAFLGAEWTVHYHSSRTGVRLVGPRPEWARPDGGDAGLHPSNVHDNAYAFGAIDFTGDMPVILGPDGPSLGGFVCPGAVIEADRWKLGQLGAGRPRAARRGDGGGGEPDRTRTRRGHRGGLVAGVRRARDHARGGGGPDRRGGRRYPRAPRRPGRAARGVRPPRARHRHAPAGARARGRDRGGTGSGRARDDGRHPLRAHPLRPEAPLGARTRPRPRAPLRAGARRGAAGGVADRAPAAVLGRPGLPRRDRPLRAERAPGRALVSRQHRVHPPHQRPAGPPGGEGHRVRRRVPRHGARRRLSRRPGRHPRRSPAPAGDHQVQPGADLDRGELRRDRRRLPLRLRHGGPGGLPVRRPHAAGVEP